ncbi:MAG: 2-hydroxyacid dehydrogenase [Actinomycetes bacterium]
MTRENSLRTIVTPDWVAEGYTFPSDIRVIIGNDLADVARDELATADYVVLPYLGSSIPLSDAISRMTNVQVIQTLTAGFDNVVGLVPDGVTLCNAAGVHDASTSEMAVVLTLSALRDIPQSVHAQDRGEWVHYFSRSLSTKTVLLIGYGGVGKATEKRLLPFECTVIPVATHARDHVRAMADLDALIPTADIIILTVPLNEGTTKLVDASFISKMKQDALLVNVARGPVVDTEALIQALRDGRIHAALDVTDPEPLPEGHALWSTPNTLIAPHLGGDTDVFEPRARNRIHDQWDRWLSGRPLDCIIKH